MLSGIPSTSAGCSGWRDRAGREPRPDRYRQQPPRVHALVDEQGGDGAGEQEADPLVGSSRKDSHGDHLESLQKGRELRARSDARSPLRPLQVHVPAARNRRVPVGARRHQRLVELQGVRAAPPGAHGPRRLDVGAALLRRATAPDFLRSIELHRSWWQSKHPWPSFNHSSAPAMSLLPPPARLHPRRTGSRPGGCFGAGRSGIARIASVTGAPAATVNTVP